MISALTRFRHKALMTIIFPTVNTAEYPLHDPIIFLPTASTVTVNHLFDDSSAYLIMANMNDFVLFDDMAHTLGLLSNPAVCSVQLLPYE